LAKTLYFVTQSQVNQWLKAVEYFANTSQGLAEWRSPPHRREDDWQPAGHYPPTTPFWPDGHFG